MQEVQLSPNAHVQGLEDSTTEGANMSGIWICTEEKAAVSGSREKGTGNEQPYSL